MKDKLDSTGSYDDIIDLPHHVSQSRLPMSIFDRAAQFSPFAALTGHDAAIKETARLTDHRIELDENRKQLLDERLQFLRSHLKEHPKLEFTYFVPDMVKEGGSYHTLEGQVNKINEYKQVIILEDEQEIEIAEILSVDGELFKELDPFV